MNSRQGRASSDLLSQKGLLLPEANKRNMLTVLAWIGIVVAIIVMVAGIFSSLVGMPGSIVVLVVSFILSVCTHWQRPPWWMLLVFLLITIVAELGDNILSGWATTSSAPMGRRSTAAVPKRRPGRWSAGWPGQSSAACWLQHRAPWRVPWSAASWAGTGMRRGRERASKRRAGPAGVRSWGGLLAGC